MYWKIIIWRKKTFIAIVLLKTYPIAFYIIITYMELNFKEREKVKICKLYLKWASLGPYVDIRFIYEYLHGSTH